MRYLKKFILVGFIASVLMLSFSMSASAFEPLNEPTYSGVSSDDVVYFKAPSSSYLQYDYIQFYLVHYNNSYYTYAIAFSFANGYGLSDLDLSFAIFKNGSHYYASPAFKYNSGGNNVAIFSKFNCYCFNQDGSYYRDQNAYPKSYVGYWVVNNLFDLGYSVPTTFEVVPIPKMIYDGSNYLEISDFVSSGVSGNNGYSFVNGFSFSNSYFNYYMLYNLNEYTNMVSGTDTDKLGIISGSGSASIERDSNGNITNITNNYEFDLGLNDSPVPDRWGDDFPDPEQDLLDQLPGINSSDVSSINSNLSSNSLNSSSIQWLYARFEDVTSNNKFRSVMLTMLSISVIAFTLNKRGVL